jgi:hypothetical protein
MRTYRSAGRFQATPSGGTFKLTCQMQNRVRPCRVLLHDLDSFAGRQYLELDFTAMSLVVHLFHNRQRSGPGADHKSPTLPRFLLSNRERCMPKPVTEPSGWLFLALADAASVPSRGPEQLTSSVKIIFERIESAPSIRAMAAKRSSKLSIRRRFIVEIELTFLGQLRFFWASRQTREKKRVGHILFCGYTGRCVRRRRSRNQLQRRCRDRPRNP